MYIFKIDGLKTKKKFKFITDAKDFCALFDGKYKFNFKHKYDAYMKNAVIKKSIVKRKKKKFNLLLYIMRWYIKLFK